MATTKYLEDNIYTTVRLSKAVARTLHAFCLEHGIKNYNDGVSLLLLGFSPKEAKP